MTLLGAPSLKAALDIDWGDPAAQTDALARLLAEVDRVEAVGGCPRAGRRPRRPCRRRSRRCGACWRKTSSPIPPRDSGGSGAASPPTACPHSATRRCAMGAKRRTKRFTGDKRHVIKLVDADLIVGAVVRPANEPEHHALAPVGARRAPAWAARRGPDGLRVLGESARERLLAAPGRGDSREGVDEHATADGFRSRPSGLIRRQAQRRLSRAAARHAIPTGATARPFRGRRVSTRARSVRRVRRLRAADARSRSTRRRRLLQTLRPHQQRPEGRARPPRPHHRGACRSPASINIEGPKARYKGARKNTLDLRRVAVFIANLQRMARLAKAA